MIPIKSMSPWHSGFSHLNLVIGDFIELDMKSRYIIVKEKKKSNITLQENEL